MYKKIVEEKVLKLTDVAYKLLLVDGSTAAIVIQSRWQYMGIPWDSFCIHTADSILHNCIRNSNMIEISNDSKNGMVNVGQTVIYDKVSEKSYEVKFTRTTKKFLGIKFSTGDWEEQ